MSLFDEAHTEIRPRLAEQLEKLTIQKPRIAPMVECRTIPQLDGLRIGKHGAPANAIGGFLQG